MRRAIGRFDGSASSLLSRSSAAFIINTAGSSFRQAQDIADPDDEITRRQITAMSLSPFMKLSPAERSSVILMDVIGYSLSEIGEIMEVTIPAVKAALHRGRTRLKALSDSSDAGAGGALTEPGHQRLRRLVQPY